MNLNTEKRLLQIIVIIACIVPLVAGFAGMILGVKFLSEGSVNLDSHFRYLSGLLFGIGVGFLCMVPSIEFHTKRFQLLTWIVVMGGFSRLIGALLIGWPDNGMLLALGMELFITPALCIWQNSFAQRYSIRILVK